MKFVFTREITEYYEVEALDADHAREIMEGCEDLGQHFLYSHSGEEFKLAGTKLSEGNILPRKTRKK